MKKFLLALALVALPLLGAQAQVPSAQPVYAIHPEATVFSVLKTPASAANGGVSTGQTVNGADQTNPDSDGALCVMDIADSSGTQSATWALQGKDLSGSYYTIGAVQNMTSNTAARPQGGVYVYPGALNGATGIPTGMVAYNFVLPRVWRIQAVFNTLATMTAKVHCTRIQ